MNLKEGPVLVHNLKVLVFGLWVHRTGSVGRRNHPPRGEGKGEEGVTPTVSFQGYTSIHSTFFHSVLPP